MENGKFYVMARENNGCFGTKLMVIYNDDDTKMYFKTREEAEAWTKSDEAKTLQNVTFDIYEEKFIGLDMSPSDDE